MALLMEAVRTSETVVQPKRRPSSYLKVSAIRIYVCPFSVSIRRSILVSAKFVKIDQCRIFGYSTVSVKYHNTKLQQALSKGYVLTISIETTLIVLQIT